MRTVTLLVVGFLGLSGCGMIGGYKSDQLMEERTLAIESSRELDPIRQKVWMGLLTDDPPLRMLTLSEKASDAEKSGIEKWRDILLEYKKKLFALNKRYYGSRTANREEVVYANRIALVVELYSQNISYGEYNKKTKDLSVKEIQEDVVMQQQHSLAEAMRPPAPPAPKTSFTCTTIGVSTTCN